MENAVPPLDGLTVLFLEDNALVAIDSAETLSDLGAAHVEIASTLAAAEAYAATHRIDAAMLDIHSHGLTSFDLAGQLLASGVPVALMSGSSSPVMIPPSLSHLPMLDKPYLPTQLTELLLRLVGRGP